MGVRPNLATKGEKKREFTCSTSLNLSKEEKNVIIIFFNKNTLSTFIEHQ